VAYVRKLPSGKFNAIVRLPNGKRKSITDPMKRVVEQRARELEMAISRGEPVHLRDRKLTVEQWSTRWLAARSVEPTTGRKDESRLRLHILPHWGPWPLAAIGRMDVAAWVKKLSRSGLGAPTVGGAYQLFTTLMADAALEGLITASPCHRIELPRVAKPAPRWLTRHEYDRLQLVLATRTIMSGGRVPVPDPFAPMYRALVGLACFSGLRPGELAGLDVGSVDLERGLVRVSQVKTRHGLRSYPKTDASQRTVPFPEEVADLLWPLIGYRSEVPVFRMPRGGRLEFEGNFRARVWVPALAEAGIEPVRFYVCRHTCASWLVQAGVPDRKIMQVLGHSNDHLIRVYAHLAPDQHDEVRAAWGENPRRTGDPRALRVVTGDW
jgi:integrase